MRPRLASPARWTDFSYTQARIDLTTQEVRIEEKPCADLEDFLGGIGRSLKILGGVRVRDPFDPASPLIMNLGVLTGTNAMTGLRVFFSAYSPLKVSNRGLPAVTWSTASGKFGAKLHWLGLDEAIFVGRAERPLTLVFSAARDGGVTVRFEDAAGLRGMTTHDKIMMLLDRYPRAHFAALGPAGENWSGSRFAAIAVSTENQLRSRDDKPRFAGRGGMGNLLGSKNVLAMVADVEDRQEGRPSARLAAINKEIARGNGSRKYRDADKGGGIGGTMTNYEPLFEVGALPENNFWASGTAAPKGLFRGVIEQQFVIKDESCYKCGILCHKNVYEKATPGESSGRFRAKFDYEPLNLLATNLGIHDAESACRLVARCDLLGFDAISLGVTLGYVMEYNRRHPEAPIAGGVGFGDAEGALKIIEKTARGDMPQIGQGVKRLSEELGETAYAMQVKGLELPAYLPETNPGYPFALSGGHMTMRTFLLAVLVGDFSIEYWQEAILGPGLQYLRDDLVGLCKFCGLTDPPVAEALTEVTGVPISVEEMRAAVYRTYLRGFALERRQGYTWEEYTIPARSFTPNEHLKLPHFVTPEFLEELKRRVIGKLDASMAELGISA
ncbi:MAG: aldehyde:ferredoxin oxidoreductase [Candidatus Tectomicrobia bacterium]|nr:aldehyde:ferredoxin oxidoreductase [Candidatus Tectomicrobia bacterium]